MVMKIPKNDITKHYKYKRYKREKFINKYLHGDGKVVDSFIVDKGHINGIERHDVTDNGIVLIYNVRTDKLITKKIAREGQINRYYKNVGREPPRYLIELAHWRRGLNYNY